MTERSPALKALDAEIKERVLKGIDFLKEKYGDDWVEHINMNTLELRKGDVCVLGQVHPVYYPDDGGYRDGYELAIARFDIEHNGEDLGFCAPDLDELETGDDLIALHDADEGFRANEKVWDSMNRVWKREIKKIRTRKEKK